jgi:hypothetical protein
VGGVGSNSANTITTVAGGHVTVPAYTWKVALVLPRNTREEDDVSRVSASTRTIAVIMPNVQGIRDDDWHQYLTTVDAVEALAGYDLFSNVDEAVQNAIEAGMDGDNPPGVANQLVTDNEDEQASFTVHAVSPGGPLTYFIDGPPTHGAISGSGGTLTYAPVHDFAGTDTFTFHVNDGQRDSNTGTVSIRVLEVNDPPTAGDDAKSTDEDVPLVFAAADLTANDSTGPANEAGQSLTVNSVGNATHGTVGLAGGQVTYTPDHDFNGTASFTYQVCDDGVSGGVADPKCATGTVTVTVLDKTPPTLSLPGNLTAIATTPSGAVVNYSASASDAVDGTRPIVCAPASGSTFAIGVTTVACSAADTHGNTATGSFTVTITTEDVPGRMVGGAAIEVGSIRHALEFFVQERATGADAGLLRYEVKTRGPGRDQEDRFESSTVTSVSFFDVPGVSPGHKPASGVDTVSFVGAGQWNGRIGYTFEAVATDAGEPGRGRDAFSITVRDGSGQVVASVDARITDGNIQSLRLPSR